MKKVKVSSLVIIAFVLVPLFFFSKIIYTMIVDWATFEQIHLEEYDSLFVKDAKNQLQFVGTGFSRSREPLSRYTYKDRFNIIATKFSLDNQNGLKSLINIRNASSHITMDAAYSHLSNGDLEMMLKSRMSTPVSKVYFRYNGGSLNTIQESDTFYCCFLKFNTFSINYNEEPYDIMALPTKKPLPASLAFIKKGKSLYLVLMTEKDNSGSMEVNQLYDILQDKGTSMVSN